MAGQPVGGNEMELSGGLDFAQNKKNGRVGTESYPRIVRRPEEFRALSTPLPGLRLIRIFGGSGVDPWVVEDPSLVT